MNSSLLTGIRLTVVCAIFFCGLYVAIVSAASLMSSDKGDPETVHFKSKTYYKNVGQVFNQSGYFWSRPSAVDYNGAGSGGSNKGPSNPDYLKTVEKRVDDFLAKNPTVKREQVPAELVTASGSGLDPDISPAAAYVQVDRLVKETGLPATVISTIIKNNTEKPLMGLFGPEKVNVLKLNIALAQFRSK